MIFPVTETAFSTEILSVLKMSWAASEPSVAPRAHAALVYRVRGGGTITADGRELELKPGGLLYMPSGVGYQASYTDTEIICFSFVSPKAGRNAEVCNLSGSNSVRFLFDSACKAWERKEPGYQIYALGIFFQIIALTDRDAAEQYSARSVFGAAVEILNTRFTDCELRIPDVCREAGICETTFREQFARCYGKSPVKYLTERRIEAARHLMLNSSCSVERAALDSGFSDSKYFSRVVKKLFGCSPSELRESAF